MNEQAHQDEDKSRCGDGKDLPGPYHGWDGCGAPLRQDEEDAGFCRDFPECVLP